jgi:enoyl-CoA hydratase/carnithine racemase
MPELVRFARQGNVAVITIENPPVNALSPGVPEGIHASLERANHDPEVEAIVPNTCAKPWCTACGPWKIPPSP